ncbi:MAG: isochorismatase family protein [Candidatus Aminicenantes bacterium]|nr:isochorismatase family protein [Candidatus Aminicenantes bacterium]
MQGICPPSSRASNPAAAAFAAEIRLFRRRHPQKFDPAASALLILDMQEYFLRPDSHAYIPGAPVLLPRLKKLQDRFLAAGRPVIHTRHLNQPGRAGAMETWWHDLIRKDDPLSLISLALSDSRVEVIEKSRYDAFHRTGLEARLKRLGIRRLAVAGVVTHLCLETTIRSAFVRDFECFLILDGTSDWTDAYFRGSVRNLCHGFAVPVRTGEILRTLPS